MIFSFCRIWRNKFGRIDSMNTTLLTEKVLEKGMEFSKIARLLGIDKMTLYRKLANYEPVTIREAEILKELLDLTNLEALEIFLGE